MILFLTLIQPHYNRVIKFLENIFNDFIDTGVSQIYLKKSDFRINCFFIEEPVWFVSFSVLSPPFWT